MKKYKIKIYDTELDIIQDDDGKFIKPQKIKEQESYGTAIKPAYEPIIIAMKPNDGTYANNALTWGVSGLNIDESRIGNEIVSTHNAPKGTFAGGELDRGSDTDSYTEHKGRFPANIILDEEAGKMLDEQSGITQSNKVNTLGGFGISENDYGKGTIKSERGYKDKGGASRFFKNIPLDSRFVYATKASKKEKNAGCEDLEKGNHHCTCKPLKLIEYLCVLTKTPVRNQEFLIGDMNSENSYTTGGVVLDPFMGSGTTGVACINTGRDFIGIELDEEYYEIGKARIKQTLKET